MAPPAAPTNVTATDGTYPEYVYISWTKSAGAYGYQIYRDSTPLGWLQDVDHDEDYGAGAPTITGGTSTASDGTFGEFVRLGVTGEGTSPGAVHSYEVKARNDDGESGFSYPNNGNRGVGTLSYQWLRSSGDSDDNYSTLTGANTEGYDDYSAPEPTVTPGTATASDGSSTAHVVLSLAGESANDIGRYYKCVLMADGAVTETSFRNRGYRSVGALTYIWYRSAADSNASYSPIVGGVTDPYNDTGAPAPTIDPGTADASDETEYAHVVLTLTGELTHNGDGRYYKCLVSAAGASSEFSTNNRGYRDVGALTLQWRRSAADSDESFADIVGATTDPYNDIGAPATGDGRWYYCVCSATGASSQDSTHDRGSRKFITSMIGGPTTWVWGDMTLGVSVVPITGDGGLSWAWGVVGGGDVVPDGSPTEWVWRTA